MLIQQIISEIIRQTIMYHAIFLSPRLMQQFSINVLVAIQRY